MTEDISQKIIAVNSDIAAARNKIEEMGGTITPNGGTSQLANDISTIPSGGDPMMALNGILDNTIQYIKSDIDGHIIPWFASTVGNQPNLTSPVFISLKNLLKTYGSRYSGIAGLFDGMINLKYVCLHLQQAASGTQHNFNGAKNIKSLVIRKTNGVFGLASTNNLNNSFLKLGTGFLYVPDLDDYGNNLPEQYKIATNWVSVATQIKGYSEAPAYNATTQYGIGDVCQYNEKLYGYCKEDLASATGQAPSGTTEDNDYWEWIDDIEV